MFRNVQHSLGAALLAASLGAGPTMGQQVIDVDAVPAQVDQPPILTAAELDQLLGSIALYPDPLIAQILPASTYPLDIVKAARLVRAGTTDAQIDQQDWDPSIKAIAHYPQVVEMMDSNLDWTQQLGQAFMAQPDDVMQSIQRLRVQAQTLGNLNTTAQAEVLEQDGAVCIVPANPSVIYVPVYQPSIVYYERPVYPCITFGIGFAIGAWFDLDCDWHNHFVYRPGWTWDHWHDHIVVDHNRIVRVERPEFHGGGHPTYVWHRDQARPITLPGRRMSRPSDFDRFRGRAPSPTPAPGPHRVATPVPDRGRDVHPAPREPRPVVNPAQPSSDAQRYRSRGQQSLHPGSNPPAAPPKQTPPAPAHPTPQPAPSPTHTAPPPKQTTPAPKPTPQPAAPKPGAYVGPVRPAAPPARVATPPVRIAPPPAAATRPSVPFTGRPSTPQPASPSKDNSHKGR